VLTLGGSPASTATVGAAYSFRPTLTNSTGKTATFSIANKPSWLSFSTATGSLTGTPGSGHVSTYSNITISASNGSTTAKLPAFALTVRAASSGATNAAPKISGTPPSSVRAGTAYTFRPTATDVNGDALSFSVANKPSWATFTASTGQLSGTPTTAQTGTYSNIGITVSDGKGGTASLPGFSILVSGATTGSATLAWMPPTQTTGGQSLTNLAGYRIYYGNSPNSLTQSVNVTNPGATAYTLSNLGSGTWYFGIKAYTSGGSESALSNVGSKTIS
jgi:hypothetical protein